VTTSSISHDDVVYTQRYNLQQVLARTWYAKNALRLRRWIRMALVTIWIHAMRRYTERVLAIPTLYKDTCRLEQRLTDAATNHQTPYNHECSRSTDRRHRKTQRICHGSSCQRTKCEIAKLLIHWQHTRAGSVYCTWFSNFSVQVDVTGPQIYDNTQQNGVRDDNPTVNWTHSAVVSKMRSVRSANH